MFFNKYLICLTFLFSNVNSFLLNSNINLNKKIYNDKVIKNFEPNFLDKSEMNAIVFYTGANSLIPGDIYSNFINALNYYNFSVFIAPNDNTITKELLYDIRNEYRNIIPLTHSSGYVNSIKTVYNQKNIDKAIFLDPVDNSNLFDFSITTFNKNLQTSNLNYLKNVLILNAEKSYKWQLFPKPDVPFIPGFALNIDKFQNENSNINIHKLTADNYGHSDILDSLWSDLMHATLSKGNEIREKETLDNYHLWLAENIYNFTITNYESSEIVLV